ncbi:MAG TPA: ABC transporter permease [Dehalococcoidia bacterium]|nr:ABC transporter permease [Dehalococcoidia bacterium]
MQQYIMRRILLMIPTMLFMTIVTFGLLRIPDGDFIMAQMEEARGIDPEQIERLRHELGLDAPAPIQYFRWMGNILTGDLGDSFWQQKPVTQVIARAAPISIELGILAIVIGLLISIPVGVGSAVFQNTPVDHIGRGVAIIGISIPNFFLAILVIIYGANWFGWFPPMTYQSFWEHPWGNIQQFLPGAFVLGTSISAQNMRMIRTTMLETQREDYVRTARAKGLNERSVIFKHAFRNALIPVVTLLGFQIAGTIGGSVIVETVFSINGVGRTYIDAVRQRDYPLVQGILLMLISATLISNLLVDVSYSWLDPRIRYS